MRRILFVLLLGALLVEGAVIITTGREYVRTTPVYDPPVLAGQMAPGHCSGGFYARHGEEIVLTTSAHCGQEGQVVTASDGSLYGTIGPSARLAPCSHPEKNCAGSDMNYMVIEPRFLPWGHLNEVDLGAGGYRTIPEDARPLSCADINTGDRVELNGSLRFREGTVMEKGENDFEGDGAYFPCIVVTSISAIIGDSGGAVLANGRPAGISAREFGQNLAFTPLAEGLEELGLELCTTPDCGLTPPAGPSAVPAG
jgi:hypothetical protein